MDEDGDPSGKRPFPFCEEDEHLEILSWALSPVSEAVRDALIILESAPVLTPPSLPSDYAEYRGCSVGENVGTGGDNALFFPHAHPHDALVLLESAPVATLPSSSAFAENRGCTAGGNVGDGSNENFHGRSIQALTPPLPAPHDALFSVPALPSSSAFFQYIRCSPAEEIGSCVAENIHRRFIRFRQSMAAESWRRIAAKESMSEGNGGRGSKFQRMMMERQRRERLTQSYTELHSLLPRGSKRDKISIVRSATDYLIELRWERERLWRRSRELELMNRGKAEEEGKEIRMEVKSASPFGIVISALRGLKTKAVVAEAVRTKFVGEKLTVELLVETEEGREEAERVLKAALDEIEEN